MALVAEIGLSASCMHVRGVLLEDTLYILDRKPVIVSKIGLKCWEQHETLSFFYCLGKNFEMDYSPKHLV